MTSAQIHFCCVSYGDEILVSHHNEPHVHNYVDIITSLLPLIPQVDGERKITFPAERFQVHILADNSGLVYSCITDSADRYLVPFTFLDAIRTKFADVNCINNNSPLNFGFKLEDDFSPVLAAMMFNFNIGQGDKLSLMETQVNDLKLIILNNVEKLIERGEKLEDIVAKSENLTVTSVDFQKTSRAVVRQQKCKNWKMWLVIGLSLGIILTIALLIATRIIRL